MVEILKTYEGYNFNLLKTSRESGVSRATIRKWADSIGHQVFSHNKIQDIVFKVDQSLAEKKAKFDKDVLTAKQQMLNKIIKRIPLTNDMDSLTRGLKILNELERDVKALDIKDGSDEGTINYIQIITDQLFNQKPHEAHFD
jgi:hypothetical protein